MNNKHAYTIGRVLFGLPFVVFGLNHFMMADAMTMLVPAFLPFAIFWVYFTGLILVVCGLAVMADRYRQYACYVLAVFLLLTMFSIHMIGMMSADPAMAMVSFLKDMGLLGGCLMLSAWEN